MPHRLRKIRKLRGSRTCSWGRVGQHRGRGQKGGRGKTGRHKHKWTYVVKYEPEYFGKRGFKPPLAKVYRTINVGELDEIASEMMIKGEVKFEGGKAIINLLKLGYDKLLGSGKVSRALIVKVSKSSNLAVKKIEEAGGKVIKV